MNGKATKAYEVSAPCRGRSPPDKRQRMSWGGGLA